jgi:hypothetical protein
MTLIELLIGVAISAVIMIALLELYMTGQKYFFNQNSRADAIEGGRMPMARISRDIRDAQFVINVNKIAYDNKTYSTGEGCLILAVPSIDKNYPDSLRKNPLDTSSNPDDDYYYDYVLYTVDNNKLVRIFSQYDNNSSLPNSTRILADNLVDDGQGGSPFKLKYFTSGGAEIKTGYANAFVVEIKLTSQGRSLWRGGQPFVETVQTQVKLRNKYIPS